MTTIPAFPERCDAGYDRSGVSLRDYFAAKAMLGDLIYQGLEGRESTEHIAKMAYEMADAMLRARVAE